MWPSMVHGPRGGRSGNFRDISLVLVRKMVSDAYLDFNQCMRDFIEISNSSGFISGNGTGKMSSGIKASDLPARQKLNAVFRIQSAANAIPKLSNAGIS